MSNYIETTSDLFNAGVLPNSSSADPNLTLCTFGSFWSVVTAHPYDRIVPLFRLAVSIIGIILNYFIYNVTKKPPSLVARDPTSLSKLMRYVAIWDNAFLVHFAIHEISLQIFGIDLKNLHSIVCKLYKFILWTTAINTSAHLAALAVDRAICVTNPISKFLNSPQNVSLKVSIFMTAFHSLLISPYLYVFKVENGICQPEHKLRNFIKVYQLFLSTLFYTVSHFIIVFVASVVFIFKLKKIRKPHSKKTAPLEAGATKLTVKQTKSNNSIFSGENQKPALIFVSKGNTPTDVKNNKLRYRSVPAEVEDFTDFIYAGPNNLIPTNFTANKDITPISQNAQMSGDLTKAYLHAVIVTHANFNQSETILSQITSSNAIVSNQSEPNSQTMGFNCTEKSYQSMTGARPVSCNMEKWTLNTQSEVTSQSVASCCTFNGQSKVITRQLDSSDLSARSQPSFAVIGDQSETEVLVNAGAGTCTRQMTSMNTTNNNLPEFDSQEIMPGNAENSQSEASTCQNSVPVNSRSKTNAQLMTPIDATTNQTPNAPHLIASNAKHKRNYKKGPGRNQIAKASLSLGKEKLGTALTQQDLNAIRTVQLACLWYLLCMSIATGLFIYQMIASDDYLKPKEKIFVQDVVLLCNVFNYSFNFVFFMRAKSFRDTFKDNWLLIKR